MDINTTSADLDLGKGLTRIFNQVEGSFIHEVVTKDGVKKKIVAAGKTFSKVPKELADLWMKQNPHAIVTDSEAHSKVDAKQAELDVALKEIEALKGRLAKSKPMTAAELKEAKKEADEKAAAEKEAADKKAADEKTAKDSV